MADCRTIGPRKFLRLAEKMMTRIRIVLKEKKQKEIRKYFLTFTPCTIKQIVEIYGREYLNDGGRS